MKNHQTKEGNFFIEAGDGEGASVVVEEAGFEFTGVEAVLEGVGVAGLAARGAGGGDEGGPFGKRSLVEVGRGIIAQMFYLSRGGWRLAGWRVGDWLVGGWRLAVGGWLVGGQQGGAWKRSRDRGDNGGLINTKLPKLLFGKFC